MSPAARSSGLKALRTGSSRMGSVFARLSPTIKARASLTFNEDVQNLTEVGEGTAVHLSKSVLLNDLQGMPDDVVHSPIARSRDQS